jgi:hypothetical protein
VTLGSKRRNAQLLSSEVPTTPARAFDQMFVSRFRRTSLLAAVGRKLCSRLALQRLIIVTSSVTQRLWLNVRSRSSVASTA